MKEVMGRSRSVPQGKFLMDISGKKFKKHGVTYSNRAIISKAYFMKILFK
mgnify:CR=1 FL=1